QDVFKWLPKRQKKALNLLHWWFQFRSREYKATGPRKVAAIARQVVAAVCSRPQCFLFYPDVPRKRGYSIKKIMTVLGYAPTNYLSMPTVAAIKWRDATFTPACQNLIALCKQRRVI